MTLYITSVSFEDRCLALVGDLRRVGVESDSRVAVLDFRGYENVDPYLVNRAQLMRELGALGCGVDVLEVGVSTPLGCALGLEDVMERVGAQRVVLDISTLPRSYVFTVCKVLCEKKVECTLRYYKPETYGGQLSRGVRRVQAVPGFEGRSIGSDNTTLVLILGFEGYKSLYAWEQLGPSKTIALLGDPAYRAEFLETARRSNAELFRQLGSRGVVGRLNTFDVGLACAELERLYSDLIGKDAGVEIVVCPLGTKLQCVAAFALAYRHREIGIACVSSLMYYTGDYSRGFVREYVEVSLRALVRGR